MEQYYKKTLSVMDKIGVQYFISADSLVGLTENNLFKNSKNLKIYICSPNYIKIIILLFILLTKKIILKPKVEYGKMILKIRYRPKIFLKDKTYIKCFIMKKRGENYQVSIGNKETYFSSKDISIEKKQFKNYRLNVPAKMNDFVLKYKDNLLLDFYIQHSINFNSLEEKKAIRFLFSVKKILENLSINYWIEGGTLLGAVRDKKLIPWDHDIDMGIINKSNSEIETMIKRLKEKFYVSVKSFDETKGNWKLGKFRVIKVYPKKNIFFKDSLCLDIFVYYLGSLKGSNERVYKYVVWGKNAFHKTNFFDSLEKIDFYGKPISVPSNYKEFLKVKYGPNWKVPNKKWNVALDDGSIIKE